jgi:hypothetical protein
MFKIQFDDQKFLKEMNNLVAYSEGFLSGAKDGKQNLLKNIGKTITEIAGQFIDTNSRLDPAALEHVYEWYQTGSPSGRLFEIDYIVSGTGLSFNYTFSQSTSIQQGSTVPFYNKAEIMEAGIPVTIKPRFAEVLTFDYNGEEVFTKKPVVVTTPGGVRAKDGFKDTVEVFFKQYLSQTFLDVTGLKQDLELAKPFKKNVAAGAKQGRSLGYKVGFEWVSKAGAL